MEFEKLSFVEEKIGSAIINAAYIVHKQLGPGLLERVYEICFCHELAKEGYTIERQLSVPIKYDGLSFDEGFRLDVLVGGLVIVELKAVELLNPLWEAQLLSYMKLSNKRLGFLINFKVPLIKQGIKRFIN